MQDGGSKCLAVQGWTSSDKVPARTGAVNDEWSGQGGGCVCTRRSSSVRRSYLKCGGSS